jgi:hypothetical protein
MRLSRPAPATAQFAGRVLETCCRISANALLGLSRAPGSHSLLLGMHRYG